MRDVVPFAGNALSSMIFMQGQPMLESQRPKPLPLLSGHELRSGRIVRRPHIGAT